MEGSGAIVRWRPYLVPLEIDATYVPLLFWLGALSPVGWNTAGCSHLGEAVGGTDIL